MVMMKNIRKLIFPEDELPLNKKVEIHTMAGVVRAIFSWNKYYLQIFLRKYLYKIQKRKMKN